jgi:hypothetical protein
MDRFFLTVSNTARHSIGFATVFTVSVLSLMQTGCFSIEQSHVMESKAEGLEAIHLGLGTAYALKLDASTTIFVKIQAYKKLDSKCVGGIGILPMGGKIGAQESHPSNYVAIGIQTVGMLGLMNFDKISLSYSGNNYSAEKVETLYADTKRTKEHQQPIPASKEPVWFQVRYPVNLDVKNPLKLTIGGFSHDGKEVPSKTVNFTPTEISYTANYGERGC